MQLATSPTITTRIVLKNKMGVKLGAAITPIYIYIFFNNE